MANDLIHDRGRGPEIAGTRITVYNLLPHFLDASVTEDSICREYELTPEQVSAARAYILNHPETVLAGHLRIEARLAAGNPPAVIEQARQTHETFLRFKQWLDVRQRVETQEPGAESPPVADAFPTFRQWLAEQEPQPGQRS
jgi:uncharacterized protein (DUF433 family)